MTSPTRSRARLVPALMAAGPLVGALLSRLGDRLSHLESLELTATAQGLAAIAPIGLVLLGMAPGLGDGPPRPLRVLWRAVAGGVAAGALVALGVLLFVAARGSAAQPGLGAPQLGYLGFGAVAGLLVGLLLAAVALVLGVLLSRPGVRLVPVLIALLAVSLPGTVLLLLARPRTPPPEAALTTRKPPEPGKTRGAGPPEESPEQRRRRQVEGFVDELAELCRKQRAVEVEKLVLEVQGLDLLDELFRAVIDAGMYDALEATLRALPEKSPALAALVEARPGYGADTLNADTIARIRSLKEHDHSPFALIIVPGYTPLKAPRPLPVDEIDAAVKRLEAARADLERGLAPCILVSGGSVHPPGTPHNEALSMRDWLQKHGVAADRILVDPFARHSTTNLRNAGRIMRQLGLGKALIVTGFEASPFSQAFYFAHPFMSSFETRARRELGYTVGQLDGLDDHHVAFVPSPEVTRINPRDPLDW